MAPILDPVSSTAVKAVLVSKCSITVQSKQQEVEIPGGVSVRAEHSDWIQSEDTRKPDYGMRACSSVLGVLTGTNICVTSALTCLDHG